MIRLVLLCVLMVSVNSHICPCWEQEDMTENCPPPPANCPLGYTTDMCGCCPVCFKVEGEECGGTWEELGECGSDLKCGNPDDESGAEFFIYSEGVCIKQ